MRGSGWVARSIRVARERMWVVWWLLVVALIGAVAVSDRVGADHAVESTDTTAVVGSDSGTRGHVSGERPPNCSHGEVIAVNEDGEGTPTGRCRGCPQRTYWNSGGGCVPVDEDETCRRPLQARVGSWPGRCVYIFCPPNDADANQGEYRNLRTGACTHLTDDDVCPESDERWFPQYAATAETDPQGGCRPKRCTHGRTSTGRCRTVTPPTTPRPSFTGTPTDLGDRHPALAVLPCGTYSAEGNAAWYLNTARDGGALTDTADKTDYQEKMENHRGNCAPSGLFEAGIDELIVGEGPNPEFNEHYQVRWAYDARLFAKFGLVAVKPGGEFVDAPGPADFAPGDGCSGGRTDVNGDVWDRRVACGAHDLCWALVSFGASRRLTKTDCDDWFHMLMEADCASRWFGVRSTCYRWAGIWAFAVRGAAPSKYFGKVRLRNVATGLCLSVSSHGTQPRGVFQERCGSESSRVFRLRPFNGAYAIDHVASGLCLTVENTEGRPVVNGAFRFLFSVCRPTLMVLANDDGMDRYYLREGGRGTPADRPTMESHYCWAPSTTFIAASITSQACSIDNSRFLWRIEEVG